MSDVETIARRPTPRPATRARRGVAGIDSSVWLSILPGLLPIVVFSVFPLLRGMYLGFTDAESGAGAKTSVTGFANYVEIAGDPLFWDSLESGLWWTCSVTTLQVVLGLGFALLLNQRLPGQGAFRTLAVLPWAVPPVVIALMWQLVYAPNAGLLNNTINDLGVTSSNQNWLASDHAFAAVVVAGVWAALPVTTVVLLAALQGVPHELREAAWLDGAGPVSTFRAVTWPEILPAVGLVTSLNLISNFNQFSLVYVLTNGAPTGGLRLPMLLAYEEAFRYGNFGYAAALGNVMVLILAAMLLVVLRATMRNEWGSR